MVRKYYYGMEPTSLITWLTKHSHSQTTTLQLLPHISRLKARWICLTKKFEAQLKFAALIIATFTIYVKFMEVISYNHNNTQDSSAKTNASVSLIQEIVVGYIKINCVDVHVILHVNCYELHI